MATKQETYSKNQWFDYVISIGLIIAAVFIIRPPGGGIGGAIVGLIFGLIYEFTLKRVWVFAFPDLYRQWVCSECGGEVSENAISCLGCNARFEANERSRNLKEALPAASPEQL